MPNITFEHNGVTITVRERVGKDVLDTPYVQSDLVDSIAQAQGVKRDALSDYTWGRVIHFTDALMRSTIDGSLGYDWPDYERATPSAIHAAYEAWLNSAPGLMGQWRDALTAANLEKPDPNE